MRRNKERQNHTGTRIKGKETSFSYTGRERETLRRGLRILTRLIVRSHMRRHSSVNHAGTVGKSKDLAS